ncbi:DUF927 domain-containing protein [Scandinavium sp. H11S7]|uniref:DUF927 domain-containing protein n=1 Tax=Scandinavium hiltneri TaxID=2926519 RepID=A0ABT2E781_9ENTR|nr:DUF927 domain-containing protein [Scandinavium hiltneri]MCS2163703.1 DUF927 domain-containing protein [Scandinavium hiltneri]
MNKNTTPNTPFSQVKARIMAEGWRYALAPLGIPEPHGSKKHTCPICGKTDSFRIYDNGKNAGTYICTCGAAGIGFNLLELVARMRCGCAPDSKPDGQQIKQAAQLIDEVCGWGYFRQGMTSEERAQMDEQRKKNERIAAEKRREREEAAEQQARESRKTMCELLNSARPGECHYLTRKGFPIESQRLSVTADGTGIAEIHNINGELVNVQRLLAKPFPDGRSKDPMKGLPTSGMFIPVYTPEMPDTTFIIAEGYATALSLSIAVPSSRIIAAMYAGNLLSVATAFRERFPALEIVIAADNDYHAPGDVDANGKVKANMGIIKANEAARLSGALVVFPGCLGRKKQDWDDVRAELGAERMTEEFNRELAKARKERDAKGSSAATIHVPYHEINTRKQRTSIVPAGFDFSMGVPDDFEKWHQTRDAIAQDLVSIKAMYACIHWVPCNNRGQRKAYILHEPSVRGKEDEKRVTDCISTVICEGVDVIGRGTIDGEACLTIGSDTGNRITIKQSELTPKLIRVALSAIGGEPDQSTKAMEMIATIFSWKPAPKFTYSMLPGWYRLPDEDGKSRYNYTLPNGKTYGHKASTHCAMLTLPEDTTSFSVTAFEDWRNNLAALATGNPIMVFCILYALAAPFYLMATDKAKAEMPIVHIFGTTTQGKTTALKGAASVLGKPERSMYGWSATAFGLTQIATAMNNGLLILDELQLAGTGDSSEGSKLSKAFRDLSEGNGKIQGKPIGYGFIRTPRFETAILSSGELSAESFVESKGGDTSGGVGARLLDIPFIPYTDLHGYADARAYVEAFEAKASRYYGTPLDAVLSEFCNIDNTVLREKIAEQVNSFTNWLKSETSDPIVIRALSKLAPVYAIGMLTQHITGFTDDDVNSTFMALIDAYTEHNGTGNRDSRKFIAALHVAIVKDRAHIAPKNITDGADSRYIDNRAGFFETKKISEDGDETYPVWLLRPEFIKSVMPSMSYLKKLEALRQAGRYEWPVFVVNGDKPATESNATTMVKVRTGHKEGRTNTRLVIISGVDGFGS